MRDISQNSPLEHIFLKNFAGIKHIKKVNTLSETVSAPMERDVEWKTPPTTALW